MENENKIRQINPGMIWIALWVVTIVVCLYQYHAALFFQDKAYCSTLDYRNFLHLIEPKNLLGLFTLIFTGFVLTKTVQHLNVEYPLFGKYGMPIAAVVVFLLLLLINSFC